MKAYVILFSTILLAGCLQAPSNANSTQTKPTENAKMHEPESAPIISETMPSDIAATDASASGTVEAVNAGAGKITISHGPVEALGWPAMTMGFKATSEQVASVQVGQKVNFEFESEGMNGTITKITPEK